MRTYAMGLGVPEQAIVLDYAGRRTYDTCYRARHIFDVKNAILVTQSYHLTRAMFTCLNLGIDASGVPSDIRTYRKSTMAGWEAREMLAIPVALWQVWVARPLPVVGQPEPIFPVENTAWGN
jgi:SanA protein